MKTETKLRFRRRRTSRGVFKPSQGRSLARAVAYIRVSTEDQELGLEAQLEDISRWSSVNGIPVKRVFRDQCSGSTPFEQRQGWQNLRQYLAEWSHDFIVAARRDRFSRDMYYLIREERSLPKTCQLVTAQDDPELRADAPEVMLQRRIQDVMAEYERFLIRDRTKKALAVLKAKGVKLGRPEYSKSHVGKQIRTEIFKLRESGKSLREILEKLRLAHPERKWHLTQVVRLLKQQ